MSSNLQKIFSYKYFRKFIDNHEIYGIVNMKDYFKEQGGLSMKKSVVWGIIFCLSITLAFAGGSKEEKWDRSNVVMKGTDTAVRAADFGYKAVPKRPYTIAVVVKSAAIPVWESHLIAAKKAGQDMGVKILDYAPAKADNVEEQKRILEITDGKGVDEIQECSGASVRKGGKINLIGFYEDSKVVLPSLTSVVMNEVTLTGSRANPNVSDRVLNMFSAGIVKGDKVVTHTFPLEQYEQALDTFVNRKNGAIKVVVEP
jgi:Zn-dependent alcohol dehydrogenase